MYLLDTNIVVEIRKIPSGKANPSLQNWVNITDNRLFFINDVVLFELEKWLLLLERKDQKQAIVLKKWLSDFVEKLDNRVLPINQEIFLTCAKLHIPNPRPAFDSLIATTALVHDLTLVTRNEKDFVAIDGLRLFNPFL